MDYKWKIDNFDSEVFGFKVAKIENIKSLRHIVGLIDSLKKKKIDYATIRIGSNNFSLAHSLEKNGFILVDGLISLSLDLTKTDAEKIKEIRICREKDLEQMKKITKGLFSSTRITNDPITSKKADNYYYKWIENSIKRSSDSVLIWEEKNEILGFIIVTKKGRIPLVGVIEKARGKGIGKKLLKASFNVFKSWGIEEVFIDTQMGNIAALRTYQRIGFKTVNSFLTFRWSSV